MIHSSDNIKIAQNKLPACYDLDEAIQRGQWTLSLNLLNNIVRKILDNRENFHELGNHSEYLNARLQASGSLIDRQNVVDLIMGCINSINSDLGNLGKRHTINIADCPAIDKKARPLDTPISFYHYQGARHIDPLPAYSQVLSSLPLLGALDVEWAFAVCLEMIGFILSLPQDSWNIPVVAAKQKESNCFNELILGRFSKISFNRTLRIPDDGKTYPLPAGLGKLPIHRVEDFSDKVPVSWLSDGGFFIPLYQCEALFLSFEGVNWHPSIAKVCVGRINAVTGAAYSEKLSGPLQDYVVIPNQRWLDGINSGDGSVKQFVAMPLGQGYTVEAQITDEEKFGGFQLVFFEPVPGRFPERDPVVDTRVQRMEEARKRKNTKTTGLDAAPLSGPSVSLASSPTWSSDSPAVLFSASSMGIAAGGQLKQSIHPDTYGMESWDPICSKKITVHLVNSMDYKSITGKEPPPSPISSIQYQEAGIPWYHYFDETLPPVKAPSVFKRILSIAAIDKRRGKNSQPSEPPLAVPKELIHRIKTPDVHEATEMYRSRALENLAAQRWKAALREISFVIDWNADVQANDFAVRSCCNYHLANFREGSIDGTLGLEMDRESIAARSWRANCLLALGDHEGLREDAEELLGSPATELLGLEFRAEAFLLSGRYHDAIYDALSLRKREPDHARAEKILSEARLKAYEQHKGS